MNVHFRELFLCLAITVGLFIASAIEVSAQQIHACYVQKTGVIYRIDPTGALPGDLPTRCTKDAKHIKFDWYQQGPKGDQGDKGDTGPQGPPGVSGWVTNFTLGVWDSSSLKTVEASCPEGTQVLGGGANVTPESDIPPVAITRSFGLTNPIEGNPRWIATAQEIRDFAGSWRLVAVVYCGTVSS